MHKELLKSHSKIIKTLNVQMFAHPVKNVFKKHLI